MFNTEQTLDVVVLSKDEQRMIQRVARRLASFWNAGDETQYAKTLTGLTAEYATTQFFNYCLGAVPRVSFRTNYENGGDGGFDFEHPKGVTWDVKSTTTGTFEFHNLIRTRALFIVCARIWELSEVRVLGFVPVERLRAQGSFAESDLTNLRTLRRSEFLQQFFIGENPRPRNALKVTAESVGNIIPDVLASVGIQGDNR